MYPLRARRPLCAVMMFTTHVHGFIPFFFNNTTKIRIFLFFFFVSEFSFQIMIKMSHSETQQIDKRDHWSGLCNTKQKPDGR